MPELTLTPRGEFSLRAANEHFGGWIEAPPGGELVAPMAFPVEGASTSAAVLVRQTDGLAVHGDVFGSGDPDAAWRQAMAVLSLDVDGSGYANVGHRDPVIGEQQRRRPGLRPVLFNSPYEAAAAFIIGHRISIAQGRALRKRMSETLGDAIDTPVGVQHAFPRPEVLLHMEGFRSLPASKIDPLHAVAAAALDGSLDRARLRELPEADALTQLRGIPGIGPFFAQGILMRGAGLVDALTDDEVTKQAVQRAYQLAATPAREQVLELAESWRPFRMWALVLLHVWYRREAGGPVRRRSRR
jgi:DNA-3-methyladenine glycosylase II